MRSTVILWRGQCRNDGLERLETFQDHPTWFENLRLVGRPFNWFLLTEADAYEPLEGNDDRHATRRAA